MADKPLGDGAKARQADRDTPALDPAKGKRAEKSNENTTDAQSDALAELGDRTSANV